MRIRTTIPNSIQILWFIGLLMSPLTILGIGFSTPKQPFTFHDKQYSSNGFDTKPQSAEKNNKTPIGQANQNFSVYFSPPKPGTKIDYYTSIYGGSKDPLKDPKAATISKDLDYAVICVEFSDVNHDQSKESVENMIFGSSNSVKDYYEENSYGAYSIRGNISADQWISVSNTMSYYGADSSDGQIDMANGHPNQLTSDALEQADLAGVDFSKYDTNGDGDVDHLIIVHAGAGQESDTQNTDLIWSHYSGVYEVYDNVQFTDYTMVSEYGPMGVIAHEGGHDLGLIDLYDTDYSSDGIGVWGLMGSGGWLESPSHICAYNKLQLGWVNPSKITNLQEEVEISAWSASPEVYKMTISDTEYFLVENRNTNTGSYDTLLPTSGLLITHIDEEMSTNKNDQHRKVDVEEADGNGELDVHGGSQGEVGDLWINSQSGFNSESIPNSYTYENSPSSWSVKEIGDANSVVTATISKASENDCKVESIAINEPELTNLGLSATLESFSYDTKLITVNATVIQDGAKNLTDVPVICSVFSEDINDSNVIYNKTSIVDELNYGVTVDISFEGIQVNQTKKYVIRCSIFSNGDVIEENNEQILVFRAIGTHQNVSWDFEGTDTNEKNKWEFSYQRDTNFNKNDPYDSYQWELRNPSNQPDINEESMPTPITAWHIGRHPEKESWISTLIRTLEGYNATMTTTNAISLTNGDPTEAYLAIYAKYILQEITEHGQPQGESNRVYVKISSEGTNWETLKLFDGNDPEWRLHCINVSEYIGQNIYIQIRAEYENSVPEGGFFFDSLNLIDDPCDTKGRIETYLEQNEIYMTPNNETRIAIKLMNLGEFYTDYRLSIQGENTNDEITYTFGEGSEENISIAKDKFVHAHLILNTTNQAKVGEKYTGIIQLEWFDQLNNEKYYTTQNFTVILTLSGKREMANGFDQNLAVILAVTGGTLAGISVYLIKKKKKSKGK